MLTVGENGFLDLVGRCILQVTSMGQNWMMRIYNLSRKNYHLGGVRDHRACRQLTGNLKKLPRKKKTSNEGLELP